MMQISFSVNFFSSIFLDFLASFFLGFERFSQRVIGKLKDLVSSLFYVTLNRNGLHLTIGVIAPARKKMSQNFGTKMEHE